MCFAVSFTSFSRLLLLSISFWHLGIDIDKVFFFFFFFFSFCLFYSMRSRDGRSLRSVWSLVINILTDRPCSLLCLFFSLQIVEVILEDNVFTSLYHYAARKGLRALTHLRRTGTIPLSLRQSSEAALDGVFSSRSLAASLESDTFTRSVDVLLLYSNDQENKKSGKVKDSVSRGLSSLFRAGVSSSTYREPTAFVTSLRRATGWLGVQIVERQLQQDREAGEGAGEEEEGQFSYVSLEELCLGLLCLVDRVHRSVLPLDEGKTRAFNRFFSVCFALLRHKKGSDDESVYREDFMAMLGKLLTTLSFREEGRESITEGLLSPFAVFSPLSAAAVGPLGRRLSTAASSGKERIRDSIEESSEGTVEEEAEGEEEEGEEGLIGGGVIGGRGSDESGRVSLDAAVRPSLLADGSVALTLRRASRSLILDAVGASILELRNISVREAKTKKETEV